MAEFLIQDFPFFGIFARWPNNPNIEGLIQAQKITHFLIAIGKHQVPLPQIIPLFTCASWSSTRYI